MENTTVTEIPFSQFPKQPESSQEEQDIIEARKVRTGESKVVGSEFFSRFGYLEFPGVGPCIAMVIHGSDQDDVLAFHISRQKTTEQITSVIKSFLSSHPGQDHKWELEYIVREQTDPEKKTHSADSVEGNTQNANFLADVDEFFPQITHINAIFAQTSDYVNHFDWDPQHHFHTRTIA